jgi:hypothetical protein
VGLCAQALQFENHFLPIYRDYLLAQLRADDAAALRRALWFLEQIPYRDEQVRLAVHAITQGSDAALRDEAARVLAFLAQC